MYFNLVKPKKVISLIALIAFLFTNTTSYAAPSSRSLFKNKKVDHQKLSAQSEERLQKKKEVFQEGGQQTVGQKKAAKRVLSSHLKDISQISIPQELGRVIEVYNASEDSDRRESRAKSREGQKTENKLIVLIQDLHTNPEAQLNLASILELLIKDYNLNLVCSEGADGEVDTSSVSSFPAYEVREKTARLFINSGELTGEEYLSITKYPDLPIWGIEDRDIYFQNIIEFNKVMKFSPSSQTFISQAKDALEQLKTKIYSKELLTLDQKETDYENQKIETDEYLKHLSSYIQKFNISTDNYKNITILTETTEQEKKIDQQKIMQESQNLLLNLQSAITSKKARKDMDSLMIKAQLFKDQKISPFSFYSYLKDLALKHLPDELSKYPNLNDFIDYLTNVNSLDTTKLFTEMEDLAYEVKKRLARTEEQKDFITALRNIKFLEGFFNLKVSNEELNHYLQNKDSHKVAFFGSFLKPALKKYSLSNFIDFNPDLVDAHLQDLEDFYETVKQRDVAMFDNTVSEVNKRNAKVAALIHGGFHTKGITRLLRDNAYSYIVVSPYSSTDIDEENYHFLLSGKRRPINELIEEINSILRVTLSFAAPDFIRWLEEAYAQAVAEGEIDTLFTDSGARIEEQYVVAAVRMLCKKRQTTEEITQALREYFPKLDIDELVGIDGRDTFYVRLGNRFVTVTTREGIVKVANINEDGFGKLAKIGESATTEVVRRISTDEESFLDLPVSAADAGINIQVYLEGATSTDFAGIAGEIAVIEGHREQRDRTGHKVITRYVAGFLSFLNSDAPELAKARQGLEAFLRSDELKRSGISPRGKARLRALLHYSDLVRSNILATGQLPVHIIAKVQQEARDAYGVTYTQTMMCPFDETTIRAMARMAKRLGFTPVFIMAPSQSRVDGSYIGKTPEQYRDMCARIMHEEAPGIPFSVKMDHGTPKAHQARAPSRVGDIIPYVDGGSDSFLVDGSSYNDLKAATSQDRYAENIAYTVDRIVEIVERYQALHYERLPGIQVEAEEIGAVLTKAEDLDYYLITVKEGLANRGIDPDILTYVAVNIGTTHGDVFTGIDLERMEDLQAVAEKHNVFLVCHGTSSTPMHYLAFFPELTGASHIATDFALTKLRAIFKHAPELLAVYAEVLSKGDYARAEGIQAKLAKKLTSLGINEKAKLENMAELLGPELWPFVIRWGRYALEAVIEAENAYFAEHPDIHEKVLAEIEATVGRYALLYQLDGTQVFYNRNEAAKAQAAGMMTAFADSFKTTRQAPLGEGVTRRDVLAAYKDVANEIANQMARRPADKGITTEAIIPTVEGIAARLEQNGVIGVSNRTIIAALEDLGGIFSTIFPIAPTLDALPEAKAVLANHGLELDGVTVTQVSGVIDPTLGDPSQDPVAMAGMHTANMAAVCANGYTGCAVNPLTGERWPDYKDRKKLADGSAVTLLQQMLEAVAIDLDCVIIIGGSEGTTRDGSAALLRKQVLNPNGKNGIYIVHADPIENTEDHSLNQPGSWSMLFMTRLSADKEALLMQDVVRSGIGLQAFLDKTRGRALVKYGMPFGTDRYAAGVSYPGNATVPRDAVVLIDPVTDDIEDVLTQVAEEHGMTIEELGRLSHIITTDKPRHDLIGENIARLQADGNEVELTVVSGGDAFARTMALLGQPTHAERPFTFVVGGSGGIEGFVTALATASAVSIDQNGRLVMARPRILHTGTGLKAGRDMSHHADLNQDDRADFHDAGIVDPARVIEADELASYPWRTGIFAGITGPRDDIDAARDMDPAISRVRIEDNLIIVSSFVVHQGRGFVVETRYSAADPEFTRLSMGLDTVENYGILDEANRQEIRDFAMAEYVKAKNTDARARYTRVLEIDSLVRTPSRGGIGVRNLKSWFSALLDMKNRGRTAVVVLIDATPSDLDIDTLIDDVLGGNISLEVADGRIRAVTYDHDADQRYVVVPHATAGYFLVDELASREDVRNEAKARRIQMFRAQIDNAKRHEQWIFAYRRYAELERLVDDPAELEAIADDKAIALEMATAQASLLGRLALNGLKLAHDGIIEGFLGEKGVATIAAMMKEHGLVKTTTNPALFLKILGLFKDDIKDLARKGKGVEEIYNELFVGEEADESRGVVRQVAQALEPAGLSGEPASASVEVRSHLKDQIKISKEAMLLASLADVEGMVANKLPAIPGGIKAVKLAVVEGLYPNVTLVFCSPTQIKAVARAIAEGLTLRVERLLGEGATEDEIIEELLKFKSYISYFVSRVTKEIMEDDDVIARIEAAMTPEEKIELANLAMDAAVAFYVDAHAMFLDELRAAGFDKLEKLGAIPTTELDASTGVKAMAKDSRFVLALTTGEARVSPDELEKIILIKGRESLYTRYGFYVLRMMSPDPGSMERPAGMNTVPIAVWKKLAAGEGATERDVPPMELSEARETLQRAESEFGLTVDKWEEIAQRQLEGGVEGFMKAEQDLRVGTKSMDGILGLVVEEALAQEERQCKYALEQLRDVVIPGVTGDEQLARIHELRMQVLGHMYTFLAGDVLGSQQNEFRNLVTTGELEREHIIIIANSEAEAVQVAELLVGRNRVDILIAGQGALQDYDTGRINAGLADADRIPLGDFQTAPLDRAYDVDRDLTEAIIRGI